MQLPPQGPPGSQVPSGGPPPSQWPPVPQPQVYYSPDGSHWWNGTQWVPVGYVQQYPWPGVTPPKRGGHTALILTAAVVLIVILIIIFVALIAGAQSPVFTNLTVPTFTAPTSPLGSGSP